MFPRPYQLTTLQTIRSNFTAELTQAGLGRPSSLSYFSHHVPNYPQPLPQHIQVMVIGGSQITSAYIASSATQLDSLTSQSHALPRLRSIHDLVHSIQRHLHPDCTHLALNFAFPLEPLLHADTFDGRFIHGTKEHQLTGLAGKQVGETLKKMLLPQSPQLIKIACANDTVCLALAGSNSRKPSISALVVGTGINTAIVKDGSIINLETGNFNQFPQTQSGKFIDRQSDRPGTQIFEKEISGQYLFAHFNYYASTDKKHSLSPLSSSAQLSALFAPSNTNKSAQELARFLLQRSASLVAAHLAAVQDFIPVTTMIVEGAIFLHAHNYRQYVANTLRRLGARPIKFIHVKHSSLIGASRLFSPVVSSPLSPKTPASG